MTSQNEVRWRDLVIVICLQHTLFWVKRSKNGFEQTEKAFQSKLASLVEGIQNRENIFCVT